MTHTVNLREPQTSAEEAAVVLGPRTEEMHSVRFPPPTSQMLALQSQDQVAAAVIGYCNYKAQARWCAESRVCYQLLRRSSVRIAQSGRLNFDRRYDKLFRDLPILFHKCCQA